MRFTIMIVFLAILFSAKAFGGTYEVTVKGKKCFEKQNQQIECEYKIGKDLHVTISGIGQNDTGITFMKSNYDGDYYATYGLLHSCIIVKPGMKIEKFMDYAFISPRTGKVFKTWQLCKNE